MPVPLVESARLDGFDRIRLQGGRVSPAIRTAIGGQHWHVRVTTRAGVPGASVPRADFLAISGGEGAYATGYLMGGASAAGGFLLRS